MPRQNGENEPIEEILIVEEEQTVLPVAEAPEVKEETVSQEEAPVEKDSASSQIDKIGSGSFMAFIYHFFGPLLIPTYATLLIFQLSILSIMAPSATLPYTLTVFGVTCVLPFVALIILHRIKAIDRFQMPEPSERIVPYVIQFLAFGAITLFFLFKGASPWIWTVYCGAAAISLVNFVINFRIRISNHCSAIAGMLAVLIVIQTMGYPQHNVAWWAIGCVIVAGLVGTGAILIGRHTLWEVLAGYATGFLGIILFSLIR